MTFIFSADIPLFGRVAEQKIRRQKMTKTTKIVIAVIAGVIVLALGVGLNLKRAFDLRNYAIANNCEWVWQGTWYGDDRDYICK